MKTGGGRGAGHEHALRSIWTLIGRAARRRPRDASRATHAGRFQRVRAHVPCRRLCARRASGSQVGFGAGAARERKRFVSAEGARPRRRTPSRAPSLPGGGRSRAGGGATVGRARTHVPCALARTARTAEPPAPFPGPGRGPPRGGRRARSGRGGTSQGLRLRANPGLWEPCPPREDILSPPQAPGGLAGAPRASSRLRFREHLLNAFLSALLVCRGVQSK